MVFHKPNRYEQFVGRKRTSYNGPSSCDMTLYEHLLQIILAINEMLLSNNLKSVFSAEKLCLNFNFSYYKILNLVWEGPNINKFTCVQAEDPK